MESNGPKLQNVLLQNLAVDLVTFYHTVIKKQIDSSDVSSNKKTLSKLRKKYTQKLRKDDPCSVSFDNVGVRSAYLFQYCPSFTLALSWHFLTFMEGTSPKQLEKLALKDTLSICCLGGGPATDVVAVCKVLQEFRRSCAPKNEKPLLLDATVIEVENGWSTTAECVINSISELVDASVVKISRFSFLQSDLTKEMSEGVATVLGQSDLVTMTKFLSSLHGPRNHGVRTKILQDTCERMSEGSILFLLDSSGWKCFEEMVQSVGPCVQMEPVYGPSKKTTRMSKTSKATCRTLFSEIYDHQCCTAQSSNKVAAWCKTSLPASIDSILQTVTPGAANLVT